MSDQGKPDDVLRSGAEGSTAAERGRQGLRGAGSRLGSLAQAVGRGAEATAAKAKDVVETTSDRIDTFATQGPQGIRSGSSSSEFAAGSTAPASRSGSPLRRVRKARLRVSRLDPWSVMKTMLLFSVAFAIIQFIAVWIIWSIIDASGTLDSLNKSISDLVTSPTSTNTFALQDYINTHRVLGLTAATGVLEAVLLTTLATLFSFLYNLAATVLGGLEVTLAED